MVKVCEVGDWDVCVGEVGDADDVDVAADAGEDDGEDDSTDDDKVVRRNISKRRNVGILVRRV